MVIYLTSSSAEKIIKWQYHNLRKAIGDSVLPYKNLPRKIENAQIHDLDTGFTCHLVLFGKPRPSILLFVLVYYLGASLRKVPWHPYRTLAMNFNHWVQAPERLKLLGVLNPEHFLLWMMVGKLSFLWKIMGSKESIEPSWIRGRL